MIPREQQVRRRRQFLARLSRPALILAGGEIPRNYPANTYRYRADSTFLFFFQEPEVGSAALFDPGDGTVTLFVPARTVEKSLWEGHQIPLEEVRSHTGADRVLEVERLAEEVSRIAAGRPVDSLAVADPAATRLARRITGQELVFEDPDRLGTPGLIDAVAGLRLIKDPHEIEEIRRAAAVTRDGFLEVLKHTRPGVAEHVLVGHLEGTFARGGGVPAFGTILSVRGEVLHNPDHAGMPADGDLLLVDAGAELASGWGADVTRAFPVSGRFSGEARAVYGAVLAAQQAAIDGIRPGVRWRDLHLLAARVLAGGLVEMGLLRGRPADLVAAGAHALFFPHGLGHLMGLDTHDLRIFGDRILYGPGRARSTDFGLSFLRMDLDLEPGMVVTVEPGLYFVPAILGNPEFRQRFKGQVDFERAGRFLAMNGGRGFGGVRIEDDLLVTATGGEVLTPGIPKDPAEVEELAGAAPG